MILDNSSYLGMFRGWYFYMCILSDQTTGSRISLFTSWKEQLRNISLSFREILVGILSRSAGGAGGYNVSSPAKRMVYQWPFQEPQLEVPPIYKAYFSGLNFRGYIPLKYCDIYGTNVPQWNRILKFPFITYPPNFHVDRIFHEKNHSFEAPKIFRTPPHGSSDGGSAWLTHVASKCKI